MNLMRLISILATIENAKQWEADAEKYIFCIELTGLSAHSDYSDAWVNLLERKFEILLKRQRWKDLYRQMRIAHNQVSIMSEFGIRERVSTWTALRDFLGKWDVPYIRSFYGSQFFYRRGSTYQKQAYLPNLSFDKWMRVN